MNNNVEKSEDYINDDSQNLRQAFGKNFNKLKY